MNHEILSSCSRDVARFSRLPKCHCLYARGYRCIEQARSRWAKNALTTKTNHGGVCLFYRTRYIVRRLKFPSYKSLELLAVHGYAVNFILARIACASVFVDDFADLVGRTAVHAAPVIIIGDNDLYLDDQFALSSISFLNLLASADLVQHVIGPTQCAGHVGRRHYTELQAGFCRHRTACHLRPLVRCIRVFIWRECRTACDQYDGFQAGLEGARHGRVSERSTLVNFRHRFSKRRLSAF